MQITAAALQSLESVDAQSIFAYLTTFPVPLSLEVAAWSTVESHYQLIFMQHSLKSLNGNLCCDSANCKPQKKSSKFLSVKQKAQERKKEKIIIITFMKLSCAAVAG